MGQTLSVPATKKTSESGGNDKFLYAVSEMQGWRISMEDAHATVLELDSSSNDKNTFFAVYDGHGGSTVAKYAGGHVHQRLVKEESYHNKNYPEALKKAFLGTDEDLLADPAHTRDPSGCTAVAALITEDGKIYVANAGDSRSVLCSKGVVKELSFDHKPSNDTERARITAAGGFIEFNRVNGNLALSRAIGDFEFKKNYSLIPEQQVITANPDVTVHDLTPEDEFLVIACDGIWDCLTSQQVCDFVRRGVKEGKELYEIGEAMCDHCLAPDTNSGAGIGCDNMTVLIVALLQGRTKEEWYAWISDRVDKNYGYETPEKPPRLYAESRIQALKTREEARAQRERMRGEDGDTGNLVASNIGFLSNSALSGFARVLGSTGGISFHPGSGFISDTGNLMFGSTDDSDDSGDDEMDMTGNLEGIGSSFFTNSLRFDPAEDDELDSNSRLRAQLEEFEKDDVEDEHLEHDGPDSHMNESGQDLDFLQGEAPPPPSAEHDMSSSPVKQLGSDPSSDLPSAPVVAEGLMDSSEDPTKI